MMGWEAWVQVGIAVLALVSVAVVAEWNSRRN